MTKNKMKQLLFFLFTAIFSLFILGCSNITDINEEIDRSTTDVYFDAYVDGESAQTLTPTITSKPSATPTPTPEPAIEEDGWYYSKEEVALYIHTYGRLPENYLTKAEAKELGWTGGTVENYKEGAAIGGDRFGNREGLLPKKDGRQYYECDIDTKGKGSRGTRRIVFSNDGLIYYTHDHYESFELLYGDE